MSFSVCLFMQGVIRKYGGKTHMSCLHRDINMCANFLSSKRVQSHRNEWEAERAQGQGARPALAANQAPPRGLCSIDLKD